MDPDELDYRLALMAVAAILGEEKSPGKLRTIREKADFYADLAERLDDALLELKAIMEERIVKGMNVSEASWLIIKTLTPL